MTDAAIKSAITQLETVNDALLASVKLAMAEVELNNAKLRALRSSLANDIDDDTLDIINERVRAETDGRSWRTMKAQHNPETVVKVPCHAAGPVVTAVEDEQPVYLPNVGAAFGAESREPFSESD